MAIFGYISVFSVGIGKIGAVTKLYAWPSADSCSDYIQNF